MIVAMEHYLYLFINFSSIIFPFAFSFYPKANFSKKWTFLWPAMLAGALPFIAWDVWFTSMGVWGFNPDYLCGIYFFNLPLEEVLFFFCIPYACVFTYEAVNYLSKRVFIQGRVQHFITDVLIFGLLIVATFNHERWYTSLTFFATAAFLILLRRVWAADFLGKFYFAFLFILIPFFLVNGVLTGTAIKSPVVWYNNAENLGLRMGTIPVEDTFYGMLLLLINVSVFEWLQKKKGIPSKQDA